VSSRWHALPMLGQRRPAQHRGRFHRQLVTSTPATISPDVVATVNMRGTLFPQDSPRFTQLLALLRLNHESGRLTKVGDYPFEGILPENASFDASGNYQSQCSITYLCTGVLFVCEPRPELTKLSMLVGNPSSSNSAPNCMAQGGCCHP